MRRILAPALFFALLCLVPASVRADEVFVASLSGSQEVPPNASSGSGSGTVTLSGNSLRVILSFTGLGSPTVDAHIHCCTPPGANAGVAVGFVSTGFPLNVTSGMYDRTFDLTDASIYNAAFLSANGGTAAGAAAALTAGLRGGLTYLNIHTQQFRGGEIRGQLQAVPEPATLLLLGTGVAGLCGALRRRRRV